MTGYERRDLLTLIFALGCFVVIFIGSLLMAHWVIAVVEHVAEMPS